jgi:starch synthase
VLQSEDCGFWGSSVKDSYANPFFVKLCKHLWARDPNFLVIGDAWGAMGGLEDREVTMISSGVIPRLFKLPIAIA